MIFLPIELSKRGAEAILYLAKELRNRGYSCLVGDQEIILPLAKELARKGDLYLDKDLAANSWREGLYKNLEKNRVKIYSADSEGILHNDLESWIGIRYSEKFSSK